MRTYTHRLNKECSSSEVEALGTETFVSSTRRYISFCTFKRYVRVTEKHLLRHLYMKKVSCERKR